MMKPQRTTNLLTSDDPAKWLATAGPEPTKEVLSRKQVALRLNRHVQTISKYVRERGTPR